MNKDTHQLLRFDWAMKRLLRQKANFSILEGFLSELLHTKIKIKHIIESESNQENEFDKQNRVDILVENKAGELLIIEIQNHTDLYYFQRILYGVSKVIGEYITKGKEYEEIRKVYSINLVFFDLGQGTDYIYRGTTLFRGLNDDSLLTLSSAQATEFKKETPGDILPEYFVIKINQFNNIAKNTLDEWIYYFKNSTIQDHFTAQGLADAMDNLNESLLSLEDRRIYDKFLENRAKDTSERLTARMEGRKEGIKKGVEVTAKNLLQLGVAIDTIIAATGLSLEDINKLKDQLSKE